MSVTSSHQVYSRAQWGERNGKRRLKKHWNIQLEHEEHKIVMYVQMLRCNQDMEIMKKKQQTVQLFSEKIQISRRSCKTEIAFNYTIFTPF